MSTQKRKAKPKRKSHLTEEQIDAAIITEADQNSAWEKTVSVRRAKSTSLSLPAELAARAAFLAKLHRESDVEKWVERVIRERIEIEESAFAEAKRNLAS